MFTVGHMCNYNNAFTITIQVYGEQTNYNSNAIIGEVCANSPFVLASKLRWVVVANPSSVGYDMVVSLNQKPWVMGQVKLPCKESHKVLRLWT